MRLAWGKKVDQQFITKLVQIVNDFSWRPEQASDLMSCMAFESAETFSPSIRNAAGSGAVGLIQFMPRTAIDLQTSAEALSRMTAVQQLDYVRRYFQRYASRIETLSDMYMAILLPKFVGTPDESVLFFGQTVAYRQNSGLDMNKDGKVTKAEATAKVRAKFDKGMLDRYALEV